MGGSSLLYRDRDHVVQRWNFHLSREVLPGVAQKVRDGGLQGGCETHVGRDETECYDASQQVDATQYRQLVGSLLYLTTVGRHLLCHWVVLVLIIILEESLDGRLEGTEVSEGYLCLCYHIHIR